MSEFGGVTFVSLKSNHNNKFLRYNANKGKSQSYLQCSGEEKLDPLAKFAMEASENEPGLIHLRSCYNNKYLVRNSSDGNWIKVASNKKEEDQSKWSCTLFKPISLHVNEGDNKKTVLRFRHIQSGLHACLTNDSSSTTLESTGDHHLDSYSTSTSVLNHHPYAALSEISGLDDKHGDLSDTFTVVSWTAMDTLPQYLGFQGSNDKYIVPVYTTGFDILMLKFGTTDISDSHVANEIIRDGDRIVIKNMKTGRFWEAMYHSDVMARTFMISNLNTSMGFEVIKLDYDVIALKSLDTNMFCGMRVDLPEPYPLTPTYDSINKNIMLNIREYVVVRKIKDVVYDFDNAKTYDVSDVDVQTHTYKNYGSIQETYTFEVSYEYETSSMWSNTITAKVGAGMKFEMEAGIPIIAKTKFEFSGNIEVGDAYQWGSSMSKKIILKDTLPVTVPGGKQRKASYLAKKGKCDIPFSYVQTDLLYNGQTITRKLGDGIYYGSNHYDFSFEAGPEDPLISV